MQDFLYPQGFPSPTKLHDTCQLRRKDVHSRIASMLLPNRSALLLTVSAGGITIYRDRS